jgi:hypothetical protein
MKRSNRAASSCVALLAAAACVEPMVPVTDVLDESVDRADH